jgi:hypothetical protein
VCCKHVVYGIGRGNDGEVCRRSDIVGLIALGPTTDQYNTEKKTRFTKEKPLIDTYQGCNPKQKRLILYGVLHKMLYSSREKAKGQRDAMPECIKYAVRRQCADFEGGTGSAVERVGGAELKVKAESN